MLSALTKEFEKLKNDTKIRAVVLEGAGKAFCAGHNLKEMTKGRKAEDGGKAYFLDLFKRCARMMMLIQKLPQPVIAKVHGIATAAGCQLVATCDLAIAADTATFCTPGVNMGGFCTTPLVGIGRNVHRKHAMALALTGDAFPAEDAVRFGLINEAVPADALLQRTTELAERIASKSAQGIRNGKADFYRQVELPIEDAFAYANEAMIRAMTSPDAEEGKAAFFEKRSPQWGDA